MDPFFAVSMNYTCHFKATHYRVGDFDDIDLNKNGKADTEYQKTGWTTYRQKFTEPSLVHDFDKINEYAQRNQTEVITQDDIKDPLIETGGMSSETGFPRSMSLSRFCSLRLPTECLWRTEARRSLNTGD